MSPSDSEIHSNAIREQWRAEFLPKTHTLENVVRNVQKRYIWKLSGLVSVQMIGKNVSMKIHVKWKCKNLVWHNLGVIPNTQMQLFVQYFNELWYEKLWNCDADKKKTHNTYSKSPDFNRKNLLIVLHTCKSIIDRTCYVNLIYLKIISIPKVRYVFLSNFELN